MQQLSLVLDYRLTFALPQLELVGVCRLKNTVGRDWTAIFHIQIPIRDSCNSVFGCGTVQPCCRAALLKTGIIAREEAEDIKMLG